MATHDYVIDNQTTPAFRSDLNNALAAIATNNSSATAPSTTYAGLWWLDTTNNYLKIRDKNDANWIIVGEFDVANSRFNLISNSLKAASAAGIDIYNSSGTKIIDLQVASQATAEAGTNNTELMTPLRTSQAISAAGIYPQVITVKTSGNYSIPSGAKAVLIKAAGAGGGGAAVGSRDNSTYSDAGDDGGNTTVSNATLGISVTADGGKGGAATTSATTAQSGTSTGGDIIVAGGAFGGHGHFNQRNSVGGTISAEDGYPGDMVVKYVTGSVGGETLTISYGSAGAGGSVSDGIATYTGSNGQAGYVEIWVW